METSMTQPSVRGGKHLGHAQPCPVRMSPPACWSSGTGFVVPPRRSDVDEHVVDQEAILLDPRTAHTLQLNRTALAVWHQCDGRMTTVEIAQNQSESFDIDLDTALDDVEQLVAMFAEAGLLEFGGES